MTSIYRNKNIQFLLGLLTVLLLIIISLIVKIGDIEKTTGSRNLEATYHVILTMKAMEENPVGKYLFLPTVSLGGDNDKNIPWGATVPTKKFLSGGGSYIYTSFPPLGFVAPYLTFKTFCIDINQRNLAYFSFCIGAIVAIVFYILLFYLLIQNKCDKDISTAGAIFGSLVAIFSCEALQSHGIVYWCQSFYQIVLLLCLCCVVKVLKGSGSFYKNCLLFLVFLGAMTEWTGYVFAMGLAAWLWLMQNDKNSFRRLSIWVVLAVLVAGIVTVTHFSIALGTKETIMAFLGRFFARNAVAGNFRDLFRGYILSYGFFLIIFVFSFSVLCFKFCINRMNKDYDVRLFVCIFFLSIIPLIENIVMLQHASQFSFDRLKAIFPIGLLCSYAIAHSRNTLKISLIIFSILASIQNCFSYKADLGLYEDWQIIDDNNKRLIQDVEKVTDIGCATILTNRQVRGYLNIVFNRGIYEWKKISDGPMLMNERAGCSVVFVKEDIVFPDLPALREVLIFDKDGGTTNIK